MAVYHWEGKNPQGKKVTGDMEAVSQQHVFNMLRSQRIVPNTKKIKLKGTGLDRELTIPGFKAKAKTKDIVVFTRQFATMIDAGLPLVQGLEVLGRSATNPALRKILADVKEQVQQGSTFGDAVARHPAAFDDLFINMIRAGETGGVLDVILERLAAYMEKMAKLKREVKTAMIYPGVVVGVAVVVTTILLLFVIPTFAELFGDFGAALPAPTQLVINLSNFMSNNWHLIFFTLGGVFYIFRRFAKTERGKEVLHPLALKLPVAGDLIRKVSVARFASTLSTMLSSGVPILDALSICGRSSGNKVVEKEIARVRISISEGKAIAEPLLNSQIFPPMVVSMINVGESTGALDAMLNKVAQFYDEEVENSVQALKQLIEPIMIVVLGLLVGFLVVAMYLPIFKLGTVI